jgi:hypothetical protein
MPNTNKKQLTQMINSVISSREDWEQTAYNLSNVKLYEVLGSCLDLYYTIKEKPKLSGSLNTILLEKQITFKNSTSLALKLVRLIFSDTETQSKSENRMMVYQRVLTVAVESNIKGDQLSAFIEEKGGIDEMRRVSKTGLSRSEEDQKYAEIGSGLLSQPEIMLDIETFDIPSVLKPDDGQSFSLALVRQNKDKRGTIVFGTSNPKLVAAVLSIAGRQLETESVKKVKAETHRLLEADRKTDLDDLMSQLAESTLLTAA